MVTPAIGPVTTGHLGNKNTKTKIKTTGTNSSEEKTHKNQKIL